MRLSIVIPTCSREEWLERTLASLVRNLPHSNIYEVLVVSNGKPDGSPEVVQRVAGLASWLNVRHIHENVPGLLAGRHRGADEAIGNVICYLDDDVEISQTWFGAIDTAFRDPSIDLVGGPCHPIYWGTPPSWLGSFFSKDDYGRWMCTSLSLIDWGAQECDVDPKLVWGLNFAIRRASLIRFGGFNPDTVPRAFERFQGDGETGLSNKIQVNGGRARYVPGAMLWHHVPPERMSVNYFERRARFQGVCDSYTAIRQAGGLAVNQPGPASIPCVVNGGRGILRRAARKAKSWLKKKSVGNSNVTDQVEPIRIALTAAYNAGFEFHQEQAKSDECVLKWILASDYFDCWLPGEWSKVVENPARIMR